MAIIWTEKHQREAQRRTFEIAAELATVQWRDAQSIAENAWNCASSEALFRGNLSYADLDAARIDREVALVDALAAANDTTCGAIAAERARHDRVIRKLASGRYVREEVVRGDVYLPNHPEAGVNSNHDYENAKRFAALPGIAAFKPRVTRRITTRIRKAG